MAESRRTDVAKHICDWAASSLSPEHELYRRKHCKMGYTFRKNKALIAIKQSPFLTDRQRCDQSSPDARESSRNI